MASELPETVHGAIADQADRCGDPQPAGPNRWVRSSWREWRALPVGSFGQPAGDEAVYVVVLRGSFRQPRGLYRRSTPFPALTLVLPRAGEGGELHLTDEPPDLYAFGEPAPLMFD